MIRTGLPAAGVIVNSLGRDTTLFVVLIAGADDLVFFFGFFVGGRRFAMMVNASLWEAEGLFELESFVGGDRGRQRQYEILRLLKLVIRVQLRVGV